MENLPPLPDKSEYTIFDPKFYIPEEFLDNLPRFILNLYESKNVPDAEKLKLWDAFIYRYLTDDEYRKSCQGMYVVFVHRRFYDIHNCDVSDIDAPGYRKLCFEITDNPKELYMMPLFQTEVN